MTSVHFPALLVTIKLRIFDTSLGKFAAKKKTCVQMYFKPKHHLSKPESRSFCAYTQLEHNHCWHNVKLQRNVNLWFGRTHTSNIYLWTNPSENTALDYYFKGFIWNPADTLQFGALIFMTNTATAGRDFLVLKATWDAAARRGSESSAPELQVHQSETVKSSCADGNSVEDSAKQRQAVSTKHRSRAEI